MRQASAAQCAKHADLYELLGEGKAGAHGFAAERLAFIQSIIDRLPAKYVGPVKRRYADIYRREGLRAANIWLRERVGYVLKMAPTLYMTDDRVRERAEDLADLCTRRMARAGAAAYAAGVMFCRARGFEPPEPNEARGITRAGVVERLKAVAWWRRQVRVKVGRAVEALERELTLVSRTRAPYASDGAVNRRRSQRARNESILSELIAVNEMTGEEIELLEAVLASVSNRTIRRMELMTRIKGAEDYARSVGHEALFVTLTAPAYMHSARARTGAANPDWDHSTPREVQAYLCAVWARIRAELKRKGVEVYGYRVAEPHHDGTPHWHLLLFGDLAGLRRCGACIRKHALRAAPDEPGATKHRVKLEWIDWSRGTAVGYLAKYIAKNIDGHGGHRDRIGDARDIFQEGSTIEAADRVDAWSATWGIRQFQAIGQPSVTGWRELRRERNEGAIPEGLGAHWRAADGGLWHAYIRACEASPLRLVRERGEQANAYGEAGAPRTVGIETGAEPVKERAENEPRTPAAFSRITRLITRPHKWRILRKGQPLVAPWTRVNNCTPTPRGGGFSTTGPSPVPI